MKIRRSTSRHRRRRASTAATTTTARRSYQQEGTEKVVEYAIVYSFLLVSNAGSITPGSAAFRLPLDLSVFLLLSLFLVKSDSLLSDWLLFVCYLSGRDAISRLPSDHGPNNDSMTVYTWEDPSFWSSRPNHMTVNTSTTSSGGRSSLLERSPDLLPPPTTPTEEDTSKLSRLKASHGLFKMDNPLSKATSPRQRKTNMK